MCLESGYRRLVLVPVGGSPQLNKLLVPAGFAPVSLPQLFVRPKVFQQLNTRLGIDLFWGGWGNDSDHVIAVRRIDESEHAAITACRARNLAALAQINVDLRRREFVRTARLHFDKAERWAIVSDHINLGIDDHVASVAADRDPEVCRDDAIAGALEMFDGQRFAEPAQLEMRSELVRLRDRSAVASFLWIKSHFGTRMVLRVLAEDRI